MIEININELRETMLKQGKKQEFDKLMDEYGKKFSKADNIKIFGKLYEENKIEIVHIFDMDGETHKIIENMELEEGTVETVFIDFLEDYVDSNWNIKYASLNPNGIKNYFEIAVEKKEV